MPNKWRLTSFRVLILLQGIILLGTGGWLFSPFGKALEESIGLSWLFRLRGPIPPPNEVLIIAVDNRSAIELNQAFESRLWPREIYARLLDELKHRTSGPIGFDIFFRSARNRTEDQQLANAIEQANPVVLFAFLKKNSLGDLSLEQDVSLTLHSESLLLPYSLFTNAATAIAPFPLPKVPARVSQAWVYKKEFNNLATLPATMLHLYLAEVRPKLLRLMQQFSVATAQLAELQGLERQARANSQAGIRAYRQVFSQQPALKSRLLSVLGQVSGDEAEQAEKIIALINLYTAPDSLYLNFYGGRQHIKTISLSRLLQFGEQRVNLANKVVFIGYSEKYATENKDEFPTAFPGEHNNLTSGVEIAATLFANLLKGEQLNPLPAWQASILLLLWGALLLGILYRAQPWRIIPWGLGLALLYLFLAQWFFNQHQLWTPLLSPIALQLPLTLLLLLSWKLGKLRQEKTNISRAFEYHLPHAVVARLASDISKIRTDERRMYGVCLATDAGQYTALSETLDPAALRDLMNRYYEAIFNPVKQHGGYVSNILGDAMLAVWADAKTSSNPRLAACRAALEIQESSKRFSELQNIDLPTRVGIHCGQIVLGHVGAGSHYEYRAVGDIVNTASRLEGLNKILQTSILVSLDTVRQLDDVVYCPLGKYRVVGKKNPIAICQLQGTANSTDQFLLDYNRLFATALTAFEQQQWHAAKEGFEEIVANYGQLGPAALLLELSDRQVYGLQARQFVDVQLGENSIIELNKK